jgi:succinyl-CoA synthetase beta subunit
MSEGPIARARAEGRTTLTEPEAKSLLAGAGIETPESAVAGDPGAAAEAAAGIGFPVVVKVASPAVTHKSEWADGAGVALGLEGRGAVETAARRILDAADERGIDAEVLVERARDTSAGTEVIVGGLRDRSFGPVVLAGLGGVFTEVYEDTAHRIAPVDRAEARSALEELTAAELLGGYRDRPAADVDALAALVGTVGDLVVANEAIAELEVNPALATPEGAIALDALVVLTGGDEQGGE